MMNSANHILQILIIVEVMQTKWYAISESATTSLTRFFEFVIKKNDTKICIPTP